MGVVALTVQRVTVAGQGSSRLSTSSRSGFSRPVREIVVPWKVISPGGAGWMDRRLGGAETDGRTRSKVMNATSRGSDTSRIRRTAFCSGATRTRRIGALNSRHRSSLSLTYSSTPTSTVSMN
jgi:hypothetical protein